MPIEFFTILNLTKCTVGRDDPDPLDTCARDIIIAIERETGIDFSDNSKGYIHIHHPDTERFPLAEHLVWVVTYENNGEHINHNIISEVVKIGVQYLGKFRKRNTSNGEVIEVGIKQNVKEKITEPFLIRLENGLKVPVGRIRQDKALKDGSLIKLGIVVNGGRIDNRRV